MTLTDIDPNIGRHDSLGRSSNISGKGIYSKDGYYPTSNPQSNTMSHAAGVLSMLKTTTETGDIGLLSVKPNRLPQIPHAALRRQLGVAPSRTSSHYSRAESVKSRGSARSKASNQSNADYPPSEAWSYSQYPHASSLDLSSSYNGIRLDAMHQASRSIASVSDRLENDQRSFSLTKMLPPNRSLSKHRSAASLRTQGPAITRPRSPYMYPTRLRRPGFRPASPALSDSNAALYNRPPPRRLGPGSHAFSGPPIPSYNINEPHTQRYASRLGPNSRQYTPQQYSPRQYYDQYQQNSVVPRNLVIAEPRYQQRIETPPPPVAVPYPYYNRPQQPVLSNPSPLSNDNTLTTYTDPIRIHDPENSPYVGFVQRAKQALEERASMEDLRRNPRFESPKRRVAEDVVAPVAEMPASPVGKRLTRDMIKAAIGPPSDPGVASSPDGRDCRQADGSTIGGSPVRADTSFDISGVTPDPTIEISRIAPASYVIEHDEKAVPADIPVVVSAVVRIAEVKQHLSPTRNSQFLNVSNEISSKSIEAPNGTLNGLLHDGNEKPDDASKTPVKLSPELQLPTTPGKHDKRHTSLPQSQKVRNDPRINNHQSLPVPLSLEPGLRPVSKTIAVVKPEQASPGPRPSTSSVETETTVPAEEVTAPSSTQSFQTSSFPHGAIDVATWATSSVKIRSRSKSNHSESKTEPKLHQDEFTSQHRNSAALVQVPDRASSAFFGQDTALPIDNAGSVASGAAGNAAADRFSAMKQFHFPLPDLTEDSQEDSSTTNLRILGSRPPNFRMGGQKQMRREKRTPAPVPTVVESPASYVSRKLVNTKNMPSLNFSQMDLTTKLNLALNLRSSHSVDTLQSVPEHDSPQSPANQLTPPHVTSSNLLRERYKSFFSDGDVVDVVDESITEVSEKHLSNEELITEIERLSIPSVNGLTLRLSELLPAIKKCSSQLDLTSGDENVDSTIGDLRELGLTDTMGRKERAMASTLTAGEFARSRRSANGAEIGKQTGESSRFRLMIDLPPIPGEDDDPVHNPESTDDMPAELEATGPIVEANIGSCDEQKSTPVQKPRLNGQVSRPSVAGTPDSRPWNTTTNYPWNGASPAIEISTLQPGQENATLHIRERLKQISSHPELSRNTTERIVRSMSPGPHVDNFLVPTSQMDDELEHTTQSHTGIIGSIQRKMGRKPRIDKAGFPVDPIFLHPGERVTEPGDRYPTTGLTPPSHVNMDEACSYFSDDSSEHERARVGTLRKRLTKLKQRQSGIRLATQVRSASQASRREMHRAAFWSGMRDSLSDQSNMSGSSPHLVTVYEQPSAGMSKLEYRTKRIVEKFRIFWCRGGNAIRSISRTKKHSSVWYEPGDLYEGV